MLADKEKFSHIEKELTKEGVINKFEKENGVIKGRMMITLGDVPKSLGNEIKREEGDVAFIGTFDFCDSAVGILFDPKKMDFTSPLWVSLQTDYAMKPQQEWCDFFVHTIIKNVNGNGTFSIPMYTFIADNGSFTVAPEKSE